MKMRCHSLLVAAWVAILPLAAQAQTTKPTTKPATKPVAKPATKPTAKPGAFVGCQGASYDVGGGDKWKYTNLIVTLRGAFYYPVTPQFVPTAALGWACATPGCPTKAVALPA